MPTSWKSSSDIPDSATTVRDSIFHEIVINDDGHKRQSDDVGITRSQSDPMKRDSCLILEEKGDSKDSNDGASLHRKQSQAREVWKFRLRPADDDEPEDWWFASTAIPLLAATLGPMANVFSIAALVSTWRADYIEAWNDDTAIPKADPTWCIALNAVSLGFGFLGNFFLLCNFTQAVRYIVALPVTIILWFFATGILTSITICMSVYEPPIPPSANDLGETYTEGFWYAVIASILYFMCSLLLLINMLGYALGHYREHFELNDDQRNLILQTMMFFLWLAGGAGVFGQVNGWSYADSLYFCDVTILTVGFGDFYPVNDLGRGLVFPYSVGGIIVLGLVVSSISRFATQLGADKVVKKKLDRRRVKTLSMTVTTSQEKEEREQLQRAAKRWPKRGRPEISAPFDPQQRSIAFDVTTPDVRSVKSPRTVRSAYSQNLDSPNSPRTPRSWVTGLSDKVGSKNLSRSLTQSSTFSIASGPRLRRMTTRGTKLKMLRDERARFNEMRHLQDATRQWKKYVSLIMSVTAFSILWCGGAVVFDAVEKDTYFEALYFCYVSLLTIGYGDLAPRSNPGKAFFVVWSLCAIPTMTILVSNMGDTIIASYKRGTFRLGDWTLLPKKGFVKIFLRHHPRFQSWVQEHLDKQKQRDRLEQGFPIGPASPSESIEDNPDAELEQLASHKALDEHDLAQKLVDAIRETADHLRTGQWRHYTYEEWVEYTRLIRFTQFSGQKGSTAQLLDEEEADEGIVDWDWIGEDSPMMSDVSETEWVLDRLMESLDRYMRRQIPALKSRQTEHHRKSMQIDDERNVNDATGSTNTGFSPVTLLNPASNETGNEGPRLRANSAQRRTPSPRSGNNDHHHGKGSVVLHASSSFSHAPVPGIPASQASSEVQFFKPRPSSPSPDAVPDKYQIPPHSPISPLSVITGLDSTLAGHSSLASAVDIPSSSQTSDHAAIASDGTIDESGMDIERDPSSSTTIGNSDSPARTTDSTQAPPPRSHGAQNTQKRRYTSILHKRKKQPPPNRRLGSGSEGDGMQSLTAMRLRRQQ